MTNENTAISLVDVAESWKPKLRSRNDEIEKGGQLPKDLADALAADRFHSMMIPEVYGGVEADAMTCIKTIETLAQGDASAAWCVMIGATTAMVSGYIPEDTARELFPSDTPSIHAGVFAPMGKAIPDGNGYRVTGRWQWGSGSPNAEYVWGGSVVIKDGKPVALPNGIPLSRMMMFRREEVELLGTWDVSGLCGTGSTDFSVENVYTAHEHSVDLVCDKPLDRPLYKFPVFGLLATGVSAVCLGIAQAAIDELISFADAKRPQGTRKSLANRVDAQVAVSRAEMELRSAQAWLMETVHAAWEEACAGDPISVKHRQDIRMAAVNAAQSSASAVNRMYEIGGGTSVYKRSPLQRHFRDIHVANRHMMVGNSVLEQTGRLLFGLDTESTML